MSGLEVVGLVLGLYPVVIDAIRCCRSLRSGGLIENLVRDFAIEQTVFQDWIGSLLSSFIPAHELALLLDHQSPSFGRWKDARFHALLARHYSVFKATLLLQILNDIHGEIQIVRSDLSNTRAQNCHLKVRLSAAWYTVRHTRATSGLRKNIENLHRLNKQLGRLLMGQQQPVPRTSHQNRSGAPHIVPDPTGAQVYQALYENFRCECVGPHGIKFELPQLEYQNVGNISKDPDMHNPSFRLLCSPSDDENISVVRTKAIGPAMIEPSQILNEPEDCHSLVKSPRRSLSDDEDAVGEKAIGAEDVGSQLTSSIMESSFSFDGTTARTLGSRCCSILLEECFVDERDEIPDLCHKIRTLSYELSSCNSLERVGTLSGSGHSRKFEMQSVKSVDEATTQNVVSLADLFSRRQHKVSRKHRIGLALRITCAVLQFYSTPWIHDRWSWDDFSMLLASEDLQTNTLLFVDHKFYSRRSKTVMEKRLPQTGTDPLKIVGEPILIKLGCALFELAFGKRLADMRPYSECKMLDSDLQDFYTAREMLDAGYVQDEEGQAYSDVINVCFRQQIVRGTGDGMKTLRSSDDSFYNDAAKAIVTPMYDIWTSLWGTSATTIV